MKREFFEKIDCQMHSTLRSYQELQMLKHCGVTDIISTIYIPLKITKPGTVQDLCNWLIKKETERGDKIGINIHPAIGLHPLMVPEDTTFIDEALDYIENAVKSKKAVAVGETGLEKGTQEEFVCFKRHLEIAKDNRLPVIIHTPRENKPELTKIIMREIKRKKIEQAVVDHCDMTNVKIVLSNARRDIKVGLSIGKRNLSIPDALKLYKSYSYENRFVLSSNAGGANSDYLSLIKAVEAFSEAGVNPKIVKKLANDNAMDLFRGIVRKDNALLI